MKNKSSNSLYFFGLAFCITLFEFLVTYYYWGFNFEVYEVAVNLASKGIILDPTTPIQSNIHFGILWLVLRIQSFLINIPLYGIYCITILFIPINLINYILIRRINKYSFQKQLLLILFVNLLLFDNLINISNVRISILNISAFFLLFIFSQKRKIDFLIFLPLFILGCLTRVENGIIFTFAGILYYIFVENRKHLYVYITTTVIAIGIMAVFFIDLNNQNDYLKAASFTDGRIYDNEYYYNDKKQNHDSLYAFQYAINNFIDDRDVIKPQDYFSSLSTIYSIKALKSNLVLMFNNNLRWIFLLVLFSCLIFEFKKENKNYYILFLLSLLIPVMISVEKEVVGRFLIPYITIITILLLLTFHKNLKGIRLNLLIIVVTVFGIIQIKDSQKQVGAYNNFHNNFIRINNVINQYNMENKTVIFSHCFFDFYTPKLFYTPNRTQYYYLNFLWWTYYDTFLNKKKEIFSDPTCLLLEIKEIAQNGSFVYLSDSSFTESFLIKYLKFYHNSTITANIKKNHEEGFNEYDLLIKEK